MTRYGNVVKAQSDFIMCYMAFNWSNMWFRALTGLQFQTNILDFLEKPEKGWNLLKPHQIKMDLNDDIGSQLA